MIPEILGVPVRMAAHEGERADPIPSQPKKEPIETKRKVSIGLVLLVLVIACDRLLWPAHGGVTFGAMLLLLGGGLHLAFALKDRVKDAPIAWVVLVLAVAPLVEYPQPLAWGFAIAGFGAFVGILINGWRGFGVPMRRVWGLLAVQTTRDFLDATKPRETSWFEGASVRQFANDWFLAGFVGLLFVGFLGAANPFIEEMLNGIDLLPSSKSVERAFWWAFVAACFFPFLRIAGVAQAARNRVPMRFDRRLPNVFNPKAIGNALIVFNLMFAVQTVTDAAYLWGGVRLPEGMSYAQYAHRGAYPLIATALLAGGFAILAQPFVQSTWVRTLLILWVVQNVLLVASSLLRLELYVDAYGLTLLRLRAAVWMVIVVIGLVLLLVQLIRRLPVGWTILSSSAAALGVLYVCTFVNFAHVVTAHNIAHDKGHEMMCRYGAMSAAARYPSDAVCRYSPKIENWRQWDFRTYRVLRSLKQQTGAM